MSTTAGRADDAAVTERLRKLAASILRRCSPEEIVAAGSGELRLVCAWPYGEVYGEVYVLQALWQRLGIDKVIAAQAQSRRLGFDVERALFAMVANRACAPCPKLYCWEQWLKEEVHIPGTQGLSLQHLYRAMDFLEANKEPIEREIFHRVADLLNLDVEVLFYDTIFQLGVEALIPINRQSGTRVGVIGQLHLYLDDIDPRGIGSPIFGGPVQPASPIARN